MILRPKTVHEIRRLAQESREILEGVDAAMSGRNRQFTSLDSALRWLLNYAVGNGSNRQGNPYGKDEVVNALKVLAEIDGIENYLDVKLMSEPPEKPT